MPDPAVLLIRPKAQAERFAARIGRALPQARIVISPLMEIRPVMPDTPLRGAAGLVFTSENAVAAVEGHDGLHDLPVWCVGERTAAAARRAGFVRVASAASDGGDAEGLLRMLLRQRPAGPLLHLRGTHAAGDLARRLTDAGVPCLPVVVYDQPSRPLNRAALGLLAGADPVLLPVFSPRSARLFLDAAASIDAPLHPVAISPAAAAVWCAARADPLCIAARPDAEAMVESLVAAWHRIVA